MTSVLSRMTLISTIAALAVVALLFLPVADSQAAEFTAHSCAGMAHPWDDEASAYGWGGKVHPPLAVTGSCPAGLSFDTTHAVTLGQNGYWYLSPDYRLPIVRFEMTVAGGDESTGLNYRLERCSGISCSAILELSTPSTPDQERRISLDTNGATNLRITVECMRTVCNPADSLRFRDVSVTFSDEMAPVVNLSGLPIKWTKRQNLSMEYQVFDLGSGIAKHGAHTDMALDLPLNGGCEIKASPETESYVSLRRDCAASAWMPIRKSSYDDLSDGEHSLVVWAKDAVGNKSQPTRAVFKLDDIPPGRPSEPQVTGLAPGGWTPQEFVSVNWLNPTEQLTSATESGLDRYTYSLRRFEGDQSPVVSGTELFNAVTAVRGFHRNLQLPADGLWMLSLSTIDAAGNSSEPLEVPIGRDNTIPNIPEVISTGWINRRELIEGARVSIIAPSNASEMESGICGYATELNRSPIAVLPPIVNHPGDGTPMVLPAATPSGVNWLHVKAISCAGLASEVARATVLIDNLEPTVKFSEIASTTWSNRVRELQVEARDGDSGVASIQYSIDSEPDRSTEASQTTISIGEGVHHVAAAARDNAGNVSPRNRIEFRIDRTAPTVQFLGRSADRPSRVSAQVSDSLSGVEFAQIQIRREDESDGEWIGMPTSAVASSDTGRDAFVSATIPDGDLKPGVYGLRVLAIDAAGNATASSSNQEQGGQERIDLPLRSSVNLEALIAVEKSICGSSAGRRCRPPSCPLARAMCLSSRYFDYAGSRPKRTLAYGRASLLHGTLRDHSGRPMPNQLVALSSPVSTSHGALLPREPRVVLRTDSSGVFRHRIEPGPNRRLYVEFEGDDLSLPSIESADLGVQAGITLRVNKRTAHAGDRLRFTGRLRGIEPGFRASGVNISMDFWNGRGWQDGVARGKTDAFGRFSLRPFRLRNRINRPKQIKFRAVASTELSPFPYMDGVSNSVTVAMSN